MLKLETLKLIAGATIVLTAACIMLQQIMGYVFSLARLGLIIVIAIVVSSALALVVQFLVKRTKKEDSPAAETSKGEST